MTTNETAIKFAEICGYKNPRKCEITGYIEEYITVEDVVQGKATQADFASPRRFMPDNTDDVLALAIEWCKNQGVDNEGEHLLWVRGVFPHCNRYNEVSYSCIICIGYEKIVSVDSKLLSDAIMRAIIKAKEAL